MTENPGTTDLEIKRAAQLSITEISLGSLGHGFKVPLTGQILSLNQLAFLLNALNRDKLPKSSTFEISSIAAVLKSLSPAGSKLGPMLSIAMQGFLFWVSTSVLGVNIVGQMVGAVLLSLWAFVQPAIGLLMIYGFDLVTVVAYYVKRLNDDYSFLALSLLYAVSAFVVLKILLALALVVWSVAGKKEIKLLNAAKVASQLPAVGISSTPLKAALKDLTKPVFLFSFILMMIFIWQLQGSFSEKIWLSLRPLATAFIIFYVLRSPWVSQKLLELSRKSPRFEKIYAKSKRALDFVAQRSAGSPEISARREIK